MIQINLKLLKDDELLTKLKTMTAQEKELSTLILHHLQEVERRCLYLKKGFSSLFEYCTLELGYSAASAQRRISSMRLLKVIPEIEKQIVSGSLTLSNIAQAAKFFHHEEKNNKAFSISEKKEVLKQLEGKSTREAERELAGRSSEPENFLNYDIIKPVTSTCSKVQFVADQALLEKLEKIKGLLAHKNSNLTMAELITEIAQIALGKLEAKKFAKLQTQNQSNSTSRAGSDSTPTTSTVNTDTQKIEKSRYISAPVKREVYERDGGQCTYVDPLSGRKCQSKHKLEYEHLQPYALGGKNDIENICLRCRSHNLLSAVEIFGEKTRKFLRRRNMAN